MLVSGRQITPYLKLARPLGAGGMGRVWVAEHQTLETEVAVKLLNPDLAQDEQWLARFRREAQSIARIDSAHVVRVFDRGVSDDGIPYIVMELLRGEDLRTRLERDHGLPLDEVALVVDQTCKALGRAHALGIVHRDIKPENIFLTQEGADLFVKILDFGIAKRVSSKGMDVTDDHSVFGTPYYMSPEQALSTGGVDQRADLWALAVVAFQMLTGERPFVGATPGAIYVQIHAGNFGLPSELRRGLPASIDEWFKIALNRDIELRFKSAEELARAFRLALHLSVDTPRKLAVAEGIRTEASTEHAGTAGASVRTIHRSNTPVPRRIFWTTVVAAAVVLLVGWFARRNYGSPVGAPTATQVNHIPIEAIERTAGLDSRLRPEPDTSASALRREELAPPASAEPLADGSPSKNVMQRVLAATPAQSTIHGVKGKGAAAGPTSSPTASASSLPRPIKDRGF
jgi:serine/threonine-protein kinase